MRYLRSPNKSFVHDPRIQKIELKQLLASAYVLCLYKCYNYKTLELVK